MKYGLSKDAHLKYEMLIFPAVTYTASPIFCICYWKILRAFASREKNIRGKENKSASSSQDKKSTQNDVGNRQEAKLLRLAILTVTTFMVCWLPISTYGLLRGLSLTDENKDINNSLITLAFLNSLVDPFLYLFSTRKRKNVNSPSVTTEMSSIGKMTNN